MQLRREKGANVISLTRKRRLTVNKRLTDYVLCYLTNRFAEKLCSQNWKEGPAFCLELAVEVTSIKSKDMNTMIDHDGRLCYYL